MNWLRSTVRGVLLLPILMLAVGVPAEALHRAADLTSPNEPTSISSSDVGLDMQSQEGTYSNGFCTGAPRNC